MISLGNRPLICTLQFSSRTLVSPNNEESAAGDYEEKREEDEKHGIDWNTREGHGGDDSNKSKGYQEEG